MIEIPTRARCFRFQAVDSDYSAVNDLRRMNELEFIANGFEFIGTGNNSESRTGTILGLPVLLARNLQGELPYLELAADGTSGSFLFLHEIDLLLHDDLMVRGDGTQQFCIASDIIEYVGGCTIMKTGTATVTFRGNVHATGDGYLAAEGGSIFGESAILSGDLTISENARVDLCGRVLGMVDNSGELAVSEDKPESPSRRGQSIACDWGTAILIREIHRRPATRTHRSLSALFLTQPALRSNGCSAACSRLIWLKFLTTRSSIVLS